MTACARGTVLQLSSMVPPTRFGGAERVVGAFGNDLERAGFRVYNRGLRSRHGGQAGCPIPNVYWPFDGRERSAALRSVWHAVDSLTLSGRMAVNRLVEELNPDGLITHNLRGWGLAPWVVCRNRGIPLVHVVHDYGLLCNSSTLWRDNANCERICGACRPRATAAVRRWPGGTLVGVSRAVLDEHRRLGFNGSGSSAVVHPDSAAAYPDRIVRANADRIPQVFGYLGRFSPEKGIGLLVAAILGSGKRLICGGEGEYPELLELKSRAADEVEWSGWVAPAPFFEAIDVLVVPSLWREPFGLVVVEAARAGIPVLIARQPGLIEAAEVSGARHLTFAPNSVADLKKALDVPLSDYQANATRTPEANIVDIVCAIVDSAKGGQC